MMAETTGGALAGRPFRPSVCARPSASLGTTGIVEVVHRTREGRDLKSRIGNCVHLGRRRVVVRPRSRCRVDDSRKHRKIGGDPTKARFARAFSPRAERLRSRAGLSKPAAARLPTGPARSVVQTVRGDTSSQDVTPVRPRPASSYCFSIRSRRVCGGSRLATRAPAKTAWYGRIMLFHLNSAIRLP